MAEKSRSLHLRVVTFIFVLSEAVTAATSQLQPMIKIHRLKCPKRESQQMNRVFNFSSHTTCLLCNTSVPSEFLQWTFSPKEHDGRSLPNNSYIGTNLKYLIMEKYEISQYVNGGTYTCVNKNSNVVLCSFDVYVQGTYEPYNSKIFFREDESRLIVPHYEGQVLKFRWFYKKTSSSQHHFKELTSDQGAKSIDYPCEMRIEEDHIAIDNVRPECAGYYKVVERSSLANFTLTEIFKVEVSPANKRLGLKCLSEKTVTVFPHEDVHFNCSGTLPPRSQPTLKYLCQTSNGATQLNDTIMVRENDPQKTINHFHYGNSKLELEDQDFSVYLEITDVLSAYDHLVCNVTLTSSDQNISYKNYFELNVRRKSMKTTYIVLIATGCLLSVVFVAALLIRFELELAFALRHLFVLLHHNAVAESYRSRPCLILLHGPSTTEESLRVLREVRRRLPQVSCRDLAIGQPGEDRGDALHQSLVAADVAVALLSTADFGHRPAVLEKALEQCLSQLHTACLFVLLERHFRAPDSLREHSAVLAKRLRADLALCGARRRCVRCRSGTVDDAAVAELSKKLRLVLPLWSVQPVSIAPTSFELHGSV